MVFVAIEVSYAPTLARNSKKEPKKDERIKE